MIAKQLCRSVNTIERAQAIYVSRSDAEKFIELCEASGVGILGYDGIYCKEGSTESPISLIVDLSDLKKELSSSDFVRESCARSMRFLSEFPEDDDLYIDFVLDD